VRERVVFPLGFAFFSVLALLANKALGTEEQWPKTNFYRFSFRRRAVPGRAFASLDFPFVFADFGLAPLCKKKPTNQNRTMGASQNHTPLHRPRMWATLQAHRIGCLLRPLLDWLVSHAINRIVLSHLLTQH
jgi:hypothetical protein